MVPLTTTLRSPRVLLRAVDESDVELVWDASRFPNFTQGMGWEPPDTREEIRAVARDTLTARRLGKAYTFTIVRAATVAALGRMTLRQTVRPCVWSMGYWVHPEHSGQGYATEAGQLAIAFGFHQWSVDRIDVSHAHWNVASQRVIEKLGFLFIRDNPSGHTKHGQPVAVREYKQDRSDWLSSRAVRSHTRTASN